MTQHKDPMLVEETLEGTGKQVEENLAKIVKDPSSLETFSKELTEPQREMISKLLALQAKQKSANPKKIPEPPWNDLQLVALNTSIPFIGFGFMDNAILILAGDAIDIYLGVGLGITTMCAAAIGNIVSDVAGVLLGTVIEDFCASTLNLPAPKISAAQRQLRSVRFANQTGCAIGLVIGCVIGMFPLLFLDADRTHAMKKERVLDSIFQDVVGEAAGLVGAEQTRLYIRCRKPAQTDAKLFSFWDSTKATRNRDAIGLPTAEGDYLHAKYTKLHTANTSETGGERWVPLGKGLVSRTALSGEAWNIKNVQSEPDHVPDSYDYEPLNMICVPVLDGNGRTIGVLQAVNKIQKDNETNEKAGDNEDGTEEQVNENEEINGFEDSDINILQALASHVSVSLQRMYYEGAGVEEEEHEMKKTIQILKTSGLVESRDSDDDEYKSGKARGSSQEP